MNEAPRPRGIAYTSSAHLCGIDDYHQRLAPHLPTLANTLRLPSNRILRDRPISLLKQRLTYRRLAAAADRYDVALLQMLTQWNGFRLGEYLLPSFVDRLRVPLVVVMHEWPERMGEEVIGQGLGGRARRVAATAMRRIDFDGLDFDTWVRDVFLRRVAHLVVHAEHLADRLLNVGVPRDRITFSILPGYPIPERPDAAALADIPLNKRVVLLFGFPHPRKRYDLAVRALATLPDDVVLLMVGAADDEFRRGYVSELRQLATELGVADRLIVRGEVSAAGVAALFDRADIALAPVGYATGSATLGYLIAAGVPIVASDVPSVKAIRDAGGGIAMFETGSAGACANALRHVLDDGGLRSELQRRSREFASANTFAALGALIDQRLREAAHHAAPAAGTRRIAPAGAHS